MRGNPSWDTGTCCQVSRHSVPDKLSSGLRTLETIYTPSGIVKLANPPPQLLLTVAYSLCDSTTNDEPGQGQTHHMMTPPTTPLYKQRRFPAKIISHCVWLGSDACSGSNYRDTRSASSLRMGLSPRTSAPSVTALRRRYTVRKCGNAFRYGGRSLAQQGRREGRVRCYPRVLPSRRFVLGRCSGVRLGIVRRSAVWTYR
jgi:hypothetical protein